jgi:hypothetical protein
MIFNGAELLSEAMVIRIINEETIFSVSDSMMQWKISDTFMN